MPDPDGLPDEQAVANEGLDLNPTPAVELSEELSAEDLPEEFKPYVHYLPWDQIPQEARDEALKGIKKFHGEMSKGLQEANELKTQVPALQEKANFLDYLFRQPEIQQAYKKMQDPNLSSQTQETSQAQPKFSDYGLDDDVGKEIGKLVEQGIQKAMNPLNEQIRMLQTQFSEKDTRDQMQMLKAEAKAQNLPDPEAHIADIGKVLNERRATNIKDAYYLSIQNLLPEIYTTQAQKQMQTKLSQKAQTTFPPGTGPTGIPQRTDFTGADAIEKALSFTENELGVKFK